METTGHSGKLNERYLCKYSNIEEYKDGKTIEGYKLVLDMVENFYSVGTGLYRYKTGRVKRRNTDYANLYRGTEYYVEEMNDKIAIFPFIEDLYDFYPEAKDSDNVCVVRMTIGGNMITARVTNQFHSCIVFAGDRIEKIERK
jgi:hypothetical protein